MPVRCAGKTAHVFGSRKKEDICVLASQGIQVCTVKPGQTTNSSHYLSALSWEGSSLSNQSVADLGGRVQGYP